MAKNENFKKENESSLIAAQNNAIKTNYLQARIDKTPSKKTADVGYVVVEMKLSITYKVNAANYASRVEPDIIHTRNTYKE